MPTDPFVILGLEKGASQQEILDAYKTRRAQYATKLFAEGEEGAQAARMVEMIDNAYQQAMELSHEQATVSDGDNGGFEEIKQAIRDKKPDLAQQLLDKISYRGGEWHYFQSIIFYEKSWLNDSKKQLEIALELEPNNEKYKRALENLKKKINGERPFSGNTAGEQSSRHYGAGTGAAATNRTYSQSAGGDAADGVCAACQALWCADCCCECMGGDLIRCC
jgi:molecular chaperone DnaJ